MRPLIALLALLTFGSAFADGSSSERVATPVHRYIIERTFPRGALDHLDQTVKSKVNENNALLGVRWIKSYANADETKTFCVYEAPSEAAVRKAAELNDLPVDSVTEVPVDLDSGVAQNSSAKVQRK
jgi:Protein of unknown function (DUF4242)